MLYVKYKGENNEIIKTPLREYCERVGKRNNSILYKLEDYLGKKMLSDDCLKEIRNIILDTSADISRLNDNIVVFEIEGDE